MEVIEMYAFEEDIPFEGEITGYVAPVNKKQITRDEKLREEINTFIATHQDMADKEYQYQLSKILAKVEHTDTGNAIRFAARYGHQCKYVPEPDKWFVWNGSIYKKDETGQAMQYAKKVAAYIDMEADLLPLPMDDDGNLLIKPMLSPLEKATPEQEAILKKFQERDAKVEKLKKWANSSRSKRSLQAILELARDEQGITIKKSLFDADDMLLNCRNGVLDIRTGELSSHSRSYLMTKISNIVYDPSAMCPAWNKFLLKVMMNREGLVKFLKQLVGMGLIGMRYEDIFAVFHGYGSNGKSVFMITVREMLGDYSGVASQNLFMERQGDGENFEIAGLEGVRILFKDETKQGRRLDESLVKAMTGGEPVTTAYKFKDHFSYAPKFTPILSTNHKPIIRGNDNGIWRRVKLVPWEHNFDNDPEKKSKPEVLTELREELSGIFNWALEGLRDLLQNGLYVPQEVEDATQEYKEASDTIGEFISECCYIEKGSYITLTEIFKIYQTWIADEAGGHPMNKKNFGEAMVERGFEKDRTGPKGWFWKDIRARGISEEYQIKKKPTEDELLLARVKNALVPYINSDVAVLEDGNGTRWNASAITEELEKALQGSDSDKSWAKETIDSSLPVWESYKKGQ